MHGLYRGSLPPPPDNFEEVAVNHQLTQKPTSVSSDSWPKGGFLLLLMREEWQVLNV